MDEIRCRPPSTHSWEVNSAEFGATIPLGKPCGCGEIPWTPTSIWDEEVGQMVRVYPNE